VLNWTHYRKTNAVWAPQPFLKFDPFAYGGLGFNAMFGAKIDVQPGLPAYFNLPNALHGFWGLWEVGTRLF
jgi:hypothetical protein